MKKQRLSGALLCGSDLHEHDVTEDHLRRIPRALGYIPAAAAADYLLLFSESLLTICICAFARI